MRKLLLACTIFTLAGCGSTSTDNSGSPTPTPGGGAFCGQFTAGTGLICDTTTNPPTLKVNVGAGAGTIAAGDDGRFGALNPNKGKYLGVFTPSATTQANTLAAPGGQMGAGNTADGAGVGQIIFNNATGRIGVRAANEICSQITDFPGKTGAVPSAHACTSDELVANVHAGSIPVATTGLAYNTASYSEHTTGTITERSSWVSDCGGWTYNSADRYQGTKFEVLAQTFRNNLADPTKAVAIKFSSQQPCNTVLPISCCE